MFYSHEILTSKQHGVATVWLLATIGSRSALKKVNRKAIQKVNIPKACATITTPEAPMALRLQSNLLYGVSRVYSQQCAYVLHDVEQIRGKMISLFKTVELSELDLEAGKSKPEQLVIQDDPNFDPDAFVSAMDTALAILELSTQASSQRPSLGSQRSGKSIQSSGRGRLPDIVVPSDSPQAGEGYFIPGSGQGFTQRDDRTSFGLMGDSDQLFDIGLEIDIDGNMFDTTEPIPLAPMGQSIAPSPRVRSSSLISEQVRREHEEASLARQGFPGPMDIDAPPLIDEDYNNELPLAEPFSPRGTAAESAFIPLPSEEEGELEPEGQKRKRRTRQAKPIEPDEVLQIRNAELRLFDQQYLRIMDEERLAKKKTAVAKQTKQSAQASVFETGIGGIGSGRLSTKVITPLVMFTGEELRTALLGPGAMTSANVGTIENGGGQALRQGQADEDQIGREPGLLPLMGDDSGMEIGRDAPPALEDLSAQMPWNIFSSAQASRQGSRQGSIGFGPGVSSSVRGAAFSAGRPSYTGPPRAPSLERRSSQLVSPLAGRSQPPLADKMDLDILEDDDLALGVLTQEASGMQGQPTGFETQQSGLDTQSENFLHWVRQALKMSSAQDIEFEEVVPPETQSTTVAAQAFLHVLTLATRGLLKVHQEEPFSRIRMGLVA